MTAARGESGALDGRVASSKFVDDADFTLYVGDAREVLAALPDSSVDCCVTSPPYWGLRDYGTGTWTGGDEGCDHAKPTTNYNHGFNERWGQGAGQKKQEKKSEGQYAHTCEKCGATRVDRQIGLESTPELFVAEMVAVFREVRRVLADHGTCWVNLGDSYVANPGSGQARGDLGGLAGADSPRYQETMAAAHLASDGGKLNTRSNTGLKQKDLCGIPWRVAFALQADGWWLRSDIIWAKPNPMPESVTDRPTKAHEYVFLLSKSPRYFFDQEAVREPLAPVTLNDKRQINGVVPNRERNRGGRTDGYTSPSGLAPAPAAGRNVRSVWEIATQPYPEAHFATFPEELPRRAIAAGCPEWVCGTCGKPRERTIQHGAVTSTGGSKTGARASNLDVVSVNGQTPENAYNTGAFVAREKITTGWSDCGHGNYRAGIVLDPFMGSGTTALVARKLGRRSIGVELNEEYAALCAKRLQQLSLFA